MISFDTLRGVWLTMLLIGTLAFLSGCVVMFPCGEDREYCVEEDCVCGRSCRSQSCGDLELVCVPYQYEPSHGVCVPVIFQERHQLAPLDPDAVAQSSLADPVALCGAWCDRHIICLDGTQEERLVCEARCEKELDQGSGDGPNPAAATMLNCESQLSCTAFLDAAQRADFCPPL